MNDSGGPVAALVRRFGVTPERLVVVHDELDLPVAVLRVKVGGGLAGHNGLRSIRSHLHTDAFVRVRIGVDKPVSKERGADHVLARFSKRERAEVDVTLEQAADAVETILAEGADAAMNRFNG
jgi:PTH1 family peptidyl-tRNA hydrolase